MRFLCTLATAVLLLTLWPAHAANAETLAVIVAQSHAGSVVKPDELSLIYLRKRLYWKNGIRIQPVNLATDSSLRRLFSRQILGSQPESQTEYWNVQYYHGISPPHVVNSQEAVLRFVADTPGAIGYISACKADKRVNVVGWIDENGFAAEPPNLDCDS